MAIEPRRSLYEDLAAARRRVPSGSTESAANPYRRS